MRLLLLTLLVSTTAGAQITITDSDMPSVNDIVTVSLANPNDAPNPEVTDTNYLWDYSHLGITNQRVDTFVDVSNTPFAYQLFFNNVILYPDHVADFGVAAEAPDLGGFITVSDMINYYTVSSGKYEQVGFGANINSVPSSIRYIPTDSVYQFPLDYGDVGQNQYFYEISIPGVLYFAEDVVRTDTVDGWGTLITPYGSYDVVRVKSIIHRIDTTYVDQFNFGTTLVRPELIEYKWMAQGMDIPVLEIETSAGIVTIVEYQDSFIGLTAPIGTTYDPGYFDIYPNPTDDRFTAKIGLEPGVVWFHIFDAVGRHVEARLDNAIRGENLFEFDVKSLEPGVYFIRASQGDGVITKRFIRR